MDSLTSDESDEDGASPALCKVDGEWKVIASCHNAGARAIPLLFVVHSTKIVQCVTGTCVCAVFVLEDCWLITVFYINRSCFGVCVMQVEWTCR